MKVLILNGSPKAKGSASKFFSGLLRHMLFGCETETVDIRKQSDYPAALSRLETADAVIISSPLYYDAIPSHLLCFLKEAERLCKERELHFKLYALSNCGFIEGKQNALHLQMYEAWCQRAGAQWCGGVGLGGGVMLYVLMMLFPLFLFLHCCEIGYALLMQGAVSGAQIGKHVLDLLTTPFFYSGVLLFEAIMASSVRRGKRMKNLYTRALVPSFVFIPFASVFMLIQALLHGALHKLGHRVPLVRNCAYETAIEPPESAPESRGA